MRGSMDRGKGGPEVDREAAVKGTSMAVVWLTLALAAVALAAAVVTGMLWTASLEPVSDGEKVLEILREPQGPDAH